MQLPVERREFDMNRLQLLNSQADTSSLSVDEAKAVSSYLVANVPQVTVWITVLPWSVRMLSLFHRLIPLLLLRM